MLTRSTLPVILVALTAGLAFAGPSDQHFALSVGHSVQASAQGSAAAASAASTVIAVPILAFGAVVTVSGIALEEIGEGSLALGEDLARAGAGEHAFDPVVRPDGAPTLD